MQLIDGTDAAHAALSPRRVEILRELADPASATEVAGRLGLPRQQVSYHFSVLDRHGLIEEVETRRRRGFVERRFRRSGRLILDPDLVSSDVERSRDRHSADALMGAAAEALRTAGRLQQEAEAAGARLVTATLVSSVRFARPSDLGAFLDEVAMLAARYDQGPAGEGRTMRLTLLAHPGVESREDAEDDR